MASSHLAESSLFSVISWQKLIIDSPILFHASVFKCSTFYILEKMLRLLLLSVGLKNCISMYGSHPPRLVPSSWSTCASWSSPPSSPRQSKGRTLWWGSSVLATCPTTPRLPATANQAHATRRCYATLATFIASSRADCRGYTLDGTG